MTAAGFDLYLNGVHAFECTWCHGGVNEKLEKDAAHAGLIADPSDGFNNKCADCHSEIAERFATSLHYTLNGEHKLFEQRTGFAFEVHPGIEGEYNNECNKCHATCGDCHISRPGAVGGGFIQGHNIKRTPSLSDQCTACHGSRVGDEFTGKNEGIAADAHYVPAAMHCRDCHSADEMHGEGVLREHRYEVQNGPTCRGCHSIADENIYHQTHGSAFACQVCHSQDYKNCNACHVGGSGITGSSWLTFKIGRNPDPELHEGNYVVLRHIPIAEDTYSAWENTTTPFYSSVETWKYTSPHNIRRWTSRTDTTGGQSCGNACHNSPATIDGFFLRQVDLDAMTSPAERQANQHLIVPDSAPPWN